MEEKGASFMALLSPVKTDKEKDGRQNGQLQTFHFS